MTPPLKNPGYAPVLLTLLFKFKLTEERGTWRIYSYFYKLFRVDDKQYIRRHKIENTDLLFVLSQGIMVVYDVTDKDSFEAVIMWLQDIDEVIILLLLIYS